MSRDEGFPHADVDTGFLNDPKITRLWRDLAPNSDLMARALTVRLACMLTSWQKGERVSAEDAAPAWLGAITTEVEALVRAGLLDQDARIPRRPWGKWFGEARRRRDKARARWRKANENRAASTVLPRGSRDVTASQTDRQTGSQSPRGRARGKGLAPLSENDLPEFLRSTQ